MRSDRGSGRSPSLQSKGIGSTDDLAQILFVKAAAIGHRIVDSTPKARTIFKEKFMRQPSQFFGV